MDRLLFIVHGIKLCFLECSAHRNEDIASTLKVLSKEISKTKDPQPDRKRKKAVQQHATVNID